MSSISDPAGCSGTDTAALDWVIEKRFPTMLKIIRRSGVVSVTSVEVALIRHEYRRVMAGDRQ